MLDIINLFYLDKLDNNTDIDSQQINKSAISIVLPLIIREELTEQQKKCIKMKYEENLTQCEIAKRLHLSQPTVCRHIEQAKNIVNNRLAYCFVALKQAGNMWIKLEKSNAS